MTTLDFIKVTTRTTGAFASCTSLKKKSFNTLLLADVYTNCFLKTMGEGVGKATKWTGAALKEI